MWRTALNFQNTMTKVYAAIVAIPVAAILLAPALGGGSGNTHGYEGIDLAEAATSSQSSGFRGSGMSEAEAYEGLGHLNPCIFIECEGEAE